MKFFSRKPLRNLKWTDDAAVDPIAGQIRRYWSSSIGKWVIQVGDQTGGIYCSFFDSDSSILADLRESAQWKAELIAEDRLLNSIKGQS